MLFLLIQASWCKQYLALLIIASLNTVENKIHDVSNLDKRNRKRNKNTDHDAKKKDIDLNLNVLLQMIIANLLKILLLIT